MDAAIVKIQNAQELAFYFHRDQTRHYSGINYAIHPTRVAFSINYFYNIYRHKLLNYDDLVCAAFLHDTLEDTNITPEIIEKECGTTVLNLVNELTSIRSVLKTFPSKGHYLVNKMNDMSDSALFLKLLDRLDNITDAKKTRDASSDALAFYTKYSAETLFILDNLTNTTFMEIIAKIREQCTV